MLQKRTLIENKPWCVDSVTGARELFDMMCIDASKFTKDGNMQPGCKQSGFPAATLPDLVGFRCGGTEALGTKRWFCPN